jgi:hypothetical protein
MYYKKAQLFNIPPLEIIGEHSADGTIVAAGANPLTRLIPQSCKAGRDAFCNDLDKGGLTTLDMRNCLAQGFA